MADLRNRQAFLLVSSSGTNYDLLCLCGVMAKKSEQKHRTKYFAKLPYHLPLLTMMACVYD